MTTYGRSTWYGFVTFLAFGGTWIWMGVADDQEGNPLRGLVGAVALAAAGIAVVAALFDFVEAGRQAAAVEKARAAEARARAMEPPRDQ